MFATQEFRSMLQEKLTEAVSAHGLDGYKAEIVDEMQRIAVDVSSRIGPDIEASAPGGQTQEERNAETIAEEAASIATHKQHNYIEMEDIRQAITEYHCLVWPFCEEKRESKLWIPTK